MNLPELTRRLGLGDGPLRILVVEDSVAFARWLSGFLAEMGHHVDSVMGVESLEGAVATGIDLEGVEPVSLALTGIDVAFLDHYFVSTRYDGTSLTEELKRRGCRKIVAMSSDEGANRRMMKAGATMALRKSDLARMLGGQ